MEIIDKVALVTGAANGIGKTIAEYLYREGAQVYIADIDEEKGINVSEELGEKAYFLKCDITKSKDRIDLVTKIILDSSTIDILVNNAGGTLQSERDYRKQYRGDFINYDMEVYQPTFELNLYAPIDMMNLVIPSMIENDEGGSIVNISSVNAALPLELPAYSSAKAALEQVTQLYARQYSKLGVRINAIRSGPVITEDTLRAYEKDLEQKEMVLSMMPSGRIGVTDDVAKTVLFLIENEAAVGSILTIDGGFVLDTPFFRKGEE